ncbi:MAG: NADPH:quinone reductase-like Zn-dependent oxidoreductase [Candidatus Saccharimonadales bacterium]|jgi:NADPH:quinone reductase-like Zn-dependent oxidoreductase
MKAAICDKYGPPEVIQIKEIDKPILKSNDLLIQVKATSVNSGDVRIRGLRVGDGVFGSLSGIIVRIVIGFRGPRKKVLGAVLSGIVEDIGDEVDKFKVGDEVYAMTGLRFGGFAEYAALSQNKAVALKPKTASHEEAASILFGGTTALYFLRKAGIKKAKKVLIYGSSGAVGTSALQVAQYYGAEITAVSGKDGLELSTKLGAIKTYDYMLQNLADINDKFDIVFDAVGKISKKESQHLLKEDGEFITVGGMDVAKESPKDLEQLAEMFDKGSLVAVIDRTYTLDEIVEAHRYVDTGHKKGSVVVTVA